MFDIKLREWVAKRKIPPVDDTAYRRLIDDNWERVVKKRFDGVDRTYSIPIPQDWKKKGFRTKFGLGPSLVQTVSLRYARKGNGNLQIPRQSFSPVVLVVIHTCTNF